MINGVINSNALSSKMISTGKIAAVNKQVIPASTTRQKIRDNYWPTVEAGYVLYEPEIRSIRRVQVRNPRQIL